MNVILTYRKRVITQDDISYIGKLIEELWSEGRTTISHRLCEVWDWRQTNGYLKDGVCHGAVAPTRTRPAYHLAATAEYQQ
jgi:ABC-type uncharacterized transport system ATPase subunit